MSFDLPLKVKNPGTYHGFILSDDTLTLYLDGVAKVKFKADALQLTGGAQLQQGSGSVGGLYLQDETTTGVNTPRTLAASESGFLFGNFGADEKQSFTLPVIGTNVGMRFNFVVQDSDGLRINAPAGGTIRNATVVSTVGGYIESTAVGANIHVTAVTSNAYFCGGVTGVWSVLE